MAGAFPLFGQNSPAPTNVPHAFQPYTAEFKITNLRTLANGAIITRETTVIEARDSQGRQLQSSTMETPAEGRLPQTLANVHDIVEGTETNWYSSTKEVHILRMPPRDQRQGCWRDDSGILRISRYEGPKPDKPAPQGMTLPGGSTIVPAPRDKPEVEDLGTTTIQGIEVRGRRFTTTIPAGEVGNDQPIVRVSEIWPAPQLGLNLREMSDDPRSGKHTRELVSLTLAEPDPSVFLPPEGYKVITEELHQVTCPAPR
jgi:hypothetical protein